MIHARRALLPQGWARDVRVSVAGGRIASVTAGQDAQPGDTRVDTLLPAMQNLHSHTFQRAMAGLTQRRAVGRESFWTWREVMYRFLGRLTPDDVEAIAAQAFVEMAETGYAAVAEFHYLHHQPDGTPYDNIAEMSARIAAAAERAGIGLTLLPVLYTYGGAGKAALSGGQLRFGNDPDRFARLREAVCGLNLPPDAAVGLAPHSLRATAPDELSRAVALAGGAPIHLHIAEQPAEVEQIRSWLGARPVEWLVANLPVDGRWCAIHATHMTPEETAALAQTGAVAGLCPVTEADLGDGPFDGPGWLEAKGAFGVGTDSNVRISATEELRMLEYSQRLRDLARNVMAPGEGSVGAFLWTVAAKGGAQALGRKAGEIREGLWADLVAINTSGPVLGPLDGDALLDGLVFSETERVVTDLWAAGRHCVSGGRHPYRERVRADYLRVVGRLAEGV